MNLTRIYNTCCNKGIYVCNNVCPKKRELSFAAHKILIKNKMFNNLHICFGFVCFFNRRVKVRGGEYSFKVFSISALYPATSSLSGKEILVQ